MDSQRSLTRRKEGFCLHAYPLTPINMSGSDAIVVEYARMGAAPDQITLPVGSTVADLRNAVPELAGVSLRRNGVTLDEETTLNEGDRLIITKNKVEGGL